MCGDSTREGEEECDGSDLGGSSCSDLGFGAGTPICTETCVIDSSGCADGPVCGDGVRDGGEECGDANAEECGDRHRQPQHPPAAGNSGDSGDVRLHGNPEIPSGAFSKRLSGSAIREGVRSEVRPPS